MPITCIQVVQYRCPEGLEPFNKAAAIVLYINTEFGYITPAVTALENHVQLSDLESFGVKKEQTGWSRAEGPDSPHLGPSKGGAEELVLASMAALDLPVPSIYLNIFRIAAAAIVCDKGLDKRSIDQAVLAIHLCLPLQTAGLGWQWCCWATALHQAGTGKRGDPTTDPFAFLPTCTRESLCDHRVMCDRLWAWFKAHDDVAPMVWFSKEQSARFECSWHSSLTEQRDYHRKKFWILYSFFMKSAIDWRKSCDWRKTPGFLRKSEIFPVVIVWAKLCMLV